MQYLFLFFTFPSYFPIFFYYSLGVSLLEKSPLLLNYLFLLLAVLANHLRLCQYNPLSLDSLKEAFYLTPLWSLSPANHSLKYRQGFRLLQKMGRTIGMQVLHRSRAEVEIRLQV